MPRTITPNQYHLLAYNVTANLRLSFTQTQVSITIPGHLQNTTRFDDCALALKRTLVGVFSQATTCILCYTSLHPYQTINHRNLTTMNIGLTHNAVHRCGSLSYLN
jgi:hypothetical protein